MVVGFAFEGVVAVGVFAAEEHPQTREEVGGEEEGAPAFALADVDAFVGAGEVEGVAVLAEDDVAEGHGGGAAFQQGEVAEEEADEPTVDFEDAVDDLGAATGEEGEGEEEEADEGRGEGPEVGEEEGHGERIEDRGWRMGDGRAGGGA